MKRKLSVVASALGVVAVVAGFWYWLGVQTHPASSDAGGLSISRDILGSADEAFSIVTAPRPFRFPEDHGAHTDYRSEWWYFTGNLEDTNGNEYGYQFTVFRQAIDTEENLTDSDWETNQIYMAHLGLTDVQTGEYYVAERFSRGAANLSGAVANPFQVWVENWIVTGELTDQCTGCMSLSIQAENDEISLSLQLASEKPIVYQGDNGFSQKGDAQGNASYYYSFTRLNTQGTIRVAGTEYEVMGTSWMDHEWSTSSLGENLSGWDWFALQFEDGRDLMYYQLRANTGDVHSTSEGTMVDGRGNSARIFHDEVHLEATRYWSSEQTGVTYPVAWTMKFPKIELELEVEAVIDNQERNETFRYWEGAVRVAGNEHGKHFSGVGYLELVGYE